MTNKKVVMLTAENILEAPDIQHEVVEVPEWGGSVNVYGLTSTERDEYNMSNLRREKKGGDLVPTLIGATARLAAIAIRDEAGARMFDENKVKALGAKSSTALNRVAKVANRLSGLTDEEFDEIEGN